MNFMSIIWLVLCIAFLVIEMTSLSFYILPFALGAACATLYSLFYDSVTMQIAVFLVSSFIFLTFIPSCARKLTQSSAQQKGAIDRFRNETGVIIREASADNCARILVLQEEWLCRPKDETQNLKLNDQVKVIAVDGTKLVVEAVKLSS